MTFRFFYPDADPVTVAGHGNATYWLMLLVRSEAFRQYHALYYAAVAIEVVALVIGFALHLRGFATFWKLRVIHVNFMTLAAGMYAILLIGAAGRLLVIPYEIKLLKVKGLYEAPIPFLAVLIQASCANVNYILWMWTIERTCATIYVADYEKKPRLYIAFILNAVLIIASYATGYFIVTKVIHGIALTMLTFVPNVCCAMLFRWLIRYNEGRLARLTDLVKRHPDEYSLSLRLQLKENIWSMRGSKIEFGIYFQLFGLSANMVLVFGPIVLLTAPEQFETLQWFTCAGNLAFAFFYKIAPKRISDADGYFNQLENQWNHGLNVLRKL